MALLALFPILYFTLIVVLVYIFFKIFDGIRKSNLERNEILKSIHAELKRNNSTSE